MVSPAPPIAIDVNDRNEIIVTISSVTGPRSGSLTPEIAELLADTLRSAAEYVRSMNPKESDHEHRESP